jgi:hypothetical protein
MRSTNIRKVEEETIETTINYQDFKDVNGYKFAHSFAMTVGKMSLNGVVKSIDVNPKLLITADF